MDGTVFLVYVEKFLVPARLLQARLRPRKELA